VREGKIQLGDRSLEPWNVEISSAGKEDTRSVFCSLGGERDGKRNPSKSRRRRDE